MEKYKFFLLIISVLLLSGCSFEYNIKIDDNVISEENIVYIESATSNNVEDTFEKMVSKYTGPTNSLGMYESSVIKKNDIFGINYEKESGIIILNHGFRACKKVSYLSMSELKNKNKI